MIRCPDVPAPWLALLLGSLAACTETQPASPPEELAPWALVYAVDSATYTVGVPIEPNTPSYEGGRATRFSVAPRLPAGLALDARTGIISGTPSMVSAAASFTIRASNEVGEATAVVSIAVNDAAPTALAYAASSPTYTRGVPIPPNVPGHQGGSPTLYEVSPALPRGLQLDSRTGVISGTPEALVDAARFEVRASSGAGSVSTSLTITVVEPAPTGLSYAQQAAIYVRGVAITPNLPTIRGGRPSTYDVTPPLPPGLSLDPGTGAITGAPSVIAPAAEFRVRASNAAGSVATSLSITVNDLAPTNLVYRVRDAVYARGVPIEANQPASRGGVVTSYSVNPDLPAGLELEDATGEITGTPAAYSPATTYLVTASNSGGSTTAPLTIAVGTLADASQAVVSGDRGSGSPFARHVLVRGRHLDGLRSAAFRIAPQPGAASRAFHATYQLPYMKRRGFFLSQQELELLVFGLYAGTANAVEIVLGFTDGSERRISATIATERYVDPDGIYSSPRMVTTRRPGDALGFDYFWIKSGLGSPVVMDSDGNVRWAAPDADLDASSSALVGDHFVVGKGSELIHLEFDGTMTSVKLDEPRYTAFHHDLTAGKDGLLALVNGNSVSGSFRPETMVAEITPDGEVLEEWDFADILGQAMTAGGDDPDALIREGVDWFHVNSAAYVAEDDSVLVSSRESFVVKVDHDTGEIRWLFGDPTKYWYSFPSLRKLAITLPEGLYPIGQHSVTSPASGELLLFNNGHPSLGYPDGAPVGEERTFSAGSRYLIDERKGTAQEIWSYDAGKEILSTFASSIFEATPGSYLVAYSMARGNTAKLVGLRPDGEVSFDVEFPSRLTRTCWNARPLLLEELVFDD